MKPRIQRYRNPFIRIPEAAQGWTVTGYRNRIPSILWFATWAEALQSALSDFDPAALSVKYGGPTFFAEDS